MRECQGTSSGLPMMSSVSTMMRQDCKCWHNFLGTHIIQWLYATILDKAAGFYQSEGQLLHANWDHLFRRWHIMNMINHWNTSDVDNDLINNNHLIIIFANDMIIILLIIVHLTKSNHLIFTHRCQVRAVHQSIVAVLSSVLFTFPIISQRTGQDSPIPNW